MRLAGVSLGPAFAALLLATQSAISSGPSGHVVQTTPQPVTESMPRPFDHTRHERLTCSECHGTGEQHRTVLVRNARDCASCHHDPRRGFSCANCHRTGSLPAQLSIDATLVVASGTRRRALPFGHERHASLRCTECHQTPVTLQRSRDCRSCHAEHSDPEARCTACHMGDVKSLHQAEAHLGCAGSDCHAETARIRATARATCTACHVAQTKHEPANDCASCHQVPDKARLGASSSGARR